MHQIIIRQANNHCQTNVPVEELRQLLATPDTTVWVDLLDPDEHEIDLLRDIFNFHPLAIEDAFHDQQRPKIDTYPGYYVVVFYSADYNERTGRIETHELDLFVGKNFLVSVHDDKLHQVHETITRWQSSENPTRNRIAALLYILLDTIVDDYFPLIDRIAERIEDLEDQIFTNFDNDAIQSIFELKKDMLLLRRAIAPERDLLNTMLRREIPIFESGDEIFIQDLYDHTIRVTDSIDSYRDLLSSALDSFLSLQSNRLNQIVKVLTIASIVLMSSSLVAGIYGMNFVHMPELQWHYGYAWALGLMAAISLGLIGFFRWIKWI